MPTQRVPQDAVSAADVRVGITGYLSSAGFARELVEDAALLASELVGNAVRHGRPLAAGDIEVGWAIDTTGVRVEVSDGGGSARPAIRPADPSDVSGRGLRIVAALADDWGVDEHPGRTTVWAHLAAPVPTSR